MKASPLTMDSTKGATGASDQKPFLQEMHTLLSRMDEVEARRVSRPAGPSMDPNASSSLHPTDGKQDRTNLVALSPVY